MRKLLTTTAIVAIAASPLAAQSDQGPAKMNQAVTGNDITVADVLDSTVYVQTGDADNVSWSDWTDIPDSWEASGEIDDLLLGEDGKVQAAVLSQGGILDIGDTEVQVDIEKFGVVMDSDDDGEFFVVYTGKPAELKSAQPFEGPAEGQSSAMNSAGQTGDEAAQAGADNASETGQDNMSEQGTEAASNSGKPAETGEETEAAEAENAQKPAEEGAEAASAEGEPKPAEEGAETASAEGEQNATGGGYEAASTEGQNQTMDEGTEAASAEGEQTAPEQGTESAAAGDVEGASNTDTSSDQQVAGANAEGGQATEAEGGASGETTIADMTAEELQDMPVYTSDDEWVGEISELKLGEGGDISHAVVDMGGFLGLGETPVEVPVEKVSVEQVESGGELRAYVDMTEDAMKKLKEEANRS